MQAALDRTSGPMSARCSTATKWTPPWPKAGIAPDPASLREEYDALVGRVLDTSHADHPDRHVRTTKGGRTGYMHTEHLGHLLTQCSGCSAPIRARTGKTANMEPQPSKMTQIQVWDWLDQVPDPEIPVISLVDLGIIRDVEL